MVKDTNFGTLEKLNSKKEKIKIPNITMAGILKNIADIPTKKFLGTDPGKDYAKGPFPGENRLVVKGKEFFSK